MTRTHNIEVSHVSSPTVVLHRAPWVVPVTARAVADGAVAVSGGRILAVGPFAQLRRQHESAAVFDHDGCVLVPALVNAHCHLELSHLARLGREGAPEGFCAWILRLIEQRESSMPQTIAAVAGEALADMRRRGIGLVGDIGNGDTGAVLAVDDSALCVFREFLGFAASGAERALSALAVLPPEQDVSAHAPYSTAEHLLVALSRRARGRGRVFPIHLAESPEEMEFFFRGSGPMRSLLEARGAWDGRWNPPVEGNPVFWLDRLGLLDERLLCVHVVQVEEPEVALLSRARARLCLCPGSNHALGVGRAPLPAFLAAGLLPALGTDSLASNSRLCLWREMAILRRDHPETPPAIVFAMATVAGARALDRHGDWGSLESGRRACFLAVPLPAGMNSIDEVFELLTGGDEAVAVHWIGSP